MACRWHALPDRKEKGNPQNTKIALWFWFAKRRKMMNGRFYVLLDTKEIHYNPDVERRI